MTYWMSERHRLIGKEGKCKRDMTIGKNFNWWVMYLLFSDWLTCLVGVSFFIGVSTCEPSR